VTSTPTTDELEVLRLKVTKTLSSPEFLESTNDLGLSFMQFLLMATPAADGTVPTIVRAEKILAALATVTAAVCSTVGGQRASEALVQSNVERFEQLLRNRVESMAITAREREGE